MTSATKPSDAYLTQLRKHISSLEAAIAWLPECPHKVEHRESLAAARAELAGIECHGCGTKAPTSDAHDRACPKRVTLKDAIRRESDARQEYWRTGSGADKLPPLGMEVEIARWALSL